MVLVYRKTVDSADQRRRPGEQEAWHKKVMWARIFF
jgi:hypothetical protein